MDPTAIKQNLSDAGCRSDVADEIIRMCEIGHYDAALRKMKMARCMALDELHESGRKVDCLDFLIRKTEKELQTGN